MMGGAEFFIDGAGFDEIPSSNSVKFTFEDEEEFENIGTVFNGPTISGK